MGEHGGESYEPRNVVERAADAARWSVERQLEAEGARAVRIFIAVQAEDVPEGEPDCTTHGHGFEDGRELFIELLIHAKGAAKELGLAVHVIPQVMEPGHG